MPLACGLQLKLPATAGAVPMSATLPTPSWNNSIFTLPETLKSRHTIGLSSVASQSL